MDSLPNNGNVIVTSPAYSNRRPVGKVSLKVDGIEPLQTVFPLKKTLLQAIFLFKDLFDDM